LLRIRPSTERHSSAHPGAASPRTNGFLPNRVRAQRRAAAVGFEYPDVDAALGKLHEELGELEAAPGARELGDVLFACVAVARLLGEDPELALRAAAGRFRERVELALADPTLWVTRYARPHGVPRSVAPYDLVVLRPDRRMTRKPFDGAWADAHVDRRRLVNA